MSISFEKTKKLIATKRAKLIDLRSPVDYNNNHLPNAVNIPLSRVGDIITKFRQQDTLILYSLQDNDPALAQFKNYAEQFGFWNVHIFGSITKWKNA